MEIEFSLRCNFGCPYCYVGENSRFDNELTVEEIQDTILQAKNLGAKKIIILGGEPMIYPHTMDIISFIRDQDLAVEMFTNGSKITLAMARELFRHHVRVVLKMNTFNETLQNELSGNGGAFRTIHTAFDNLKKAGYPSKQSVLAISTIICRQNFNELEDFWQWLRDQDILPYFEMITPQENANHNEWLYVEPTEVYQLFKKLCDIDRKKYNHIWNPQPPLVGNQCMRHHFSCLVTAQGHVMPCVGVTIPVGNIRDNKLADIIKDSKVVHDLRNHTDFMKGPCRSCEKTEHCYGCRGAAYQLTGDYLASDPLCWKNYNQIEVERYLSMNRLPKSVGL